jgi:ATP phosphoribosyltransferase
MTKKLRVGLPKGSLQESTLKMFRKAGYHISVGSRSYVPTFDDAELEGLLIRAQEMAPYVARGILDVGLTGHDWVMETGSDVVTVADLLYAK